MAAATAARLLLLAIAIGTAIAGRISATAIVFRRIAGRLLAIVCTARAVAGLRMII